MIEVRSLKSEGQSSKFEVPWPAFEIQGLKIKVRSSQCDNAETSHQQATQYREATKKETNVQAKSHQRATNKPQQVTGNPQTSHQQDGAPPRKQDTTRRRNPNKQRRPQRGYKTQQGDTTPTTRQDPNNEEPPTTRQDTMET